MLLTSPGQQTQKGKWGAPWKCCCPCSSGVLPLQEPSRSLEMSRLQRGRPGELLCLVCKQGGGAMCLPGCWVAPRWAGPSWAAVLGKSQESPVKTWLLFLPPLPPAKSPTPSAQLPGRQGCLCQGRSPAPFCTIWRSGVRQEGVPSSSSLGFQGTSSKQGES